ncbi:MULTISPECIES: LrgB family protein [Psychrobacter]|uniref:LrgB family protein n=1 Tax=Psychrobacter TaxID=497 RepID=UPI00146AE24C
MLKGAYLFDLSHDTILAFATRSVTIPIGLSAASLVQAPLALANLVIIISGLTVAIFARILFINISDNCDKGLALMLVAHAFRTLKA